MSNEHFYKAALQMVEANRNLLLGNLFGYAINTSLAWSSIFAGGVAFWRED
jgi:hypothetical protein